jgi:hypothetical protein
VEGDRRSWDIGNPFHVPQQVVEEREPAQLAVVDDVEPAALLHGDRLVDRAVLDPLEFGVVYPARRQRGPRLREVARAQQRADHVGVVRHRHPPVVLGNPRYLQYTRLSRRERASGPGLGGLGDGHNRRGTAPRARHN